jgi:hypothetical protein
MLSMYLAERGIPKSSLLLSRVIIVLGVGLCLSGCETGPTSFPILDQTEIRVEVTSGPTVSSDKTTPFQVTPVQMAKILKGLQIIERNTIIGFGVFGQKEGTPAFVAEEIVKLAPALSRGLRLSSSRDIVTFYSLMAGQKGDPLVTSGGVFIHNGQLHMLLANCRSRPSETSNSFVTGSELDHRHAPLSPIGRYQFRVEFNPKSALVTKDGKEDHSWGPYIDASQVVILDLVQLFPDVAGASGSQH